MKSRQTTPAVGAEIRTRRSSSRRSNLFVPPDQLEAYIQAREVLRRVKQCAGCFETSRSYIARSPLQH